MPSKILFIITIVLFTHLLSQSTLAHKHPAYSHSKDAQSTFTSWVSLINDDVLLSELSIPGTHNSMSRYGGDAVQAQSMMLDNQLRAGIRVFDIRCRHLDNKFLIYHGPFFQKVSLDFVLNRIVNFLEKYPSETVIMRIRGEGEPKGNSRSFGDSFQMYWETYNRYFWRSFNNNPPLKSLRGKIVVLQEFSSEYNYGIGFTSLHIQDKYYMSTNWKLYAKWTRVNQHLEKANKDKDNNIYMNFLSSAVGSSPYFVASGHSSPGNSAPRLATGRTTPGWKNSWKDFPRVNCFIGICTIAFEGTNILTYERLGTEYRNKVGILMMDFPGHGLIERIIKMNTPHISALD